MSHLTRRNDAPPGKAPSLFTKIRPVIEMLVGVEHASLLQPKVLLHPVLGVDVVVSVAQIGGNRFD
jgi:hypothetical protein